MSDHVTVRLAADGPAVVVDLDACERWGSTSLYRGNRPTPIPSLYRLPSGEFFRELRIDEVTRMGVGYFLDGAGRPPRHFVAVLSESAEKFLAETTTIGLPRPCIPPAPGSPGRIDPDGSDPTPDLNPGALALAAAYALKKENRKVTLKGACDKANVDRGHVREKYPEVYRAIKNMGAPDVEPRRGMRDARSGRVDGVDGPLPPGRRVIRKSVEGDGDSED